MAKVRKARKQMQLDEKVLENVERVLETRETAREVMTGARSAFAETDEAAKGKIEALDLHNPGIYSCGQFTIVLGRRPGREVSFTTKSGKVLRIRRQAEGNE